MATMRWYKGNLHMHSFWSDGGHFPEVIAQRFKAAGYHFISLTEHDQHQTGERWVTTQPPDRQAQIIAQGDLLREYIETLGDNWVEQRVGKDGATDVRLKPLHEYRHLYEEPERFLMITGEEVTVTNAESKHWMNVYHAPQVIPPLTTTGTSRDAMRYLVETIAQMARASDRPMWVQMNHPNYRYNATAEDIAAASELRFMEIHTALNSCNTYGDTTHASAERIWDTVLALRLSAGQGVLYGTVNDDCHSYHAHDTFNSGGHGEALPFRAWMMVRADKLTPDRIMHAMLRGDFYGSTGVTLDTLEADSRRLSLRVKAEHGVRYRIRFIGTRRDTDLSSQPLRDATGQVLRITQQYSAGVGAVLKEVEGTDASYDLTDDELYVRAEVISDRPHTNPTVPGDTEKAWTQPVLG